MGADPEARAAWESLRFRHRRRHDAFAEVLADLLASGEAEPRPGDRVEVMITRAEYARRMELAEPGIWGRSRNPDDLLRKAYWSRFVIWPGSHPEPWED